MNMKYLRNSLVPKSRAWVVGLALSLLVLAGFPFLVNSQPAVAHASSSPNSGGASLAAQIGSQAALNNTEVDVIATWSCVLPQGAQPQFLVITVQLSQQNGSATTSSSGTQNPQPICNGVTDEAEVAVPSPTGGQPFQAGPALASGSFSLGYCSDPSCYDLLILTDPVTITITSGTDTDLALTDMPADITQPATSADGAVVDYPPPTAVDEDDDAPTVTCDTPSGSTFPIGQTTVTCSATDSDSTPSTVSQTFTVTVTDLALPKPADIPVKATSSDGAVVDYPLPTAVDVDGPAPDVTCDMPPGSTFPVGPTTVTCTASDSDSTPSTVSTSFRVIVTDTDLMIPKPADIPATATSSAGAVVTYPLPTAVDEDGSAPTVTCDHPSGSTFPVGPTTVTCTATDSDDTNSPAITTFRVIVKDVTAPTLFLPPTFITNAATAAGTTVFYTVSATDPDNLGSQLRLGCSVPSGSTFPIGIDTVICTASDPYGNSTTGSFQIVVRGPVQTGAMGMDFWQKKTGQAIISGGASTTGVCNSATWLRQYAPFQNLNAKASCSKVASYVATVLNKASNSSALADLLNGQLLATALDVYFSDPTLGGNQLKAPAPIGGVTIDLTYICTAPTTTAGGAPTCGGTYENASSAFGGSTRLTISQMLSSVSSQFQVSTGTWYGGDQAKTGYARDAFAAINIRWAFAP